MTSIPPEEASGRGTWALIFLNFQIFIFFFRQRPIFSFFLLFTPPSIRNSLYEIQWCWPCLFTNCKNFPVSCYEYFFSSCVISSFLGKAANYGLLSTVTKIILPIFSLFVEMERQIMCLWIFDVTFFAAQSQKWPVQLSCSDLIEGRFGKDASCVAISIPFICLYQSVRQLMIKTYRRFWNRYNLYMYAGTVHFFLSPSIFELFNWIGSSKATCVLLQVVIVSKERNLLLLSENDGGRTFYR